MQYDKYELRRMNPKLCLWRILPDPWWQNLISHGQDQTVQLGN